MKGDTFPRVAIVHEWVARWGGGEAVVESLAALFPEAPIYVGIWNPDERGRRAFAHREIFTTRLQKLLPAMGRDHRRFLPLMPGAFGALDLQDFDLVISSSHAFAKAVRVRPDATHLCYCHTPPRYLWDLYDTYLPGWKGKAMRPVAAYLRRRDLQAARGVHRFVANSHTVEERIRKHYRRDSCVIHPPVDVDQFSSTSLPPGDSFLTGGRLVAYKRFDTLIRAANLGGLPLRVFGGGPEKERLRALAGPTVTFLGEISQDELVDEISQCRAFLFAAEEDFGILPVEVQAVGRPVVAWGRGGARETVLHGETGLLLDDGSPEGFLAGIREVTRRSWDPVLIRSHALRFRRERFENEILEQVALSLKPRSRV